MKKLILFLLLVIVTFPAGAQGQGARVKREADTNASAVPRERTVHERAGGLVLTQEELQLFEKGEKVRLEVKKSQANQTITITWISDNPRVALVDSMGNVSPIGLGRTIVRAKAADGTKSNDCKVTVSKPNNWGSRTGRDHMVAQNDWIYFANRADSNKLYKILINGQNLTRLSDDVPAYLNVTGRWIYYYNTNEKTRPGMYKISIDGKMRTMINDKDYVQSLWVSKDGYAFYLNGEGDVSSLSTSRAGATIRKQFDDKPVYSFAVNDNFIVYNRHWQDIPQPQGGGGLFLYNQKAKKIEHYISVSTITSNIIIDEPNNTAYFCAYIDKSLVSVQTGPDIFADIFKDKNKHPTGWFKFDLSKEDPQAEAMKKVRDMSQSGKNQSPVASKISEKYKRLAKFPLSEGDSVVWVVNGWIYFTRDYMLRRINTSGKLDQSVFGYSKFSDIGTGGDYLFYWTSENRLFRTLKDGRNALEINVKPL